MAGVREIAMRLAPQEIADAAPDVRRFTGDAKPELAALILLGVGIVARTES